VARIARFPVAVRRSANRQAGFFSARRIFVVALLLAASTFLPLRAQVFDASSAGGPVIITAPWRFHTGDDPQWASPSFDDSQWPLLRMDRSWNVQGYRGYSGYAWYRIRLQMATRPCAYPNGCHEDNRRTPLFHLPGNAELSAQTNADEQALKALPQAECDAWNKHDAHVLADLLAEDGDFVTVATVCLHGRADYEKFHARLLTGRFEDSVFTPLETTVRFLHPDIA